MSVSLPCPERRRVLARSAGLLLAGAAVQPAPTAAPVAVRYPEPQIELDKLFIGLLKLALAHEPGFELRAWQTRLQKGRALHELARGERVQVAWAVTNRERERQLRPIRIPLDKGLSGWRVCLAMQTDLPRLRAVADLAGLARLKAGQGMDWADTAVLRANGLPVVTGGTAANLFQMLAVHRFDYFPVSAGQAWDFAVEHAARGIVLEPMLALHYPSAVYFFVNQDNTALAAAIERGLLRLIGDGTFDRYFHAAVDGQLERAGLGARRVLALRNPGLPPATPLANKRLWYRPEHGPVVPAPG